MRRCFTHSEVAGFNPFHSSFAFISQSIIWFTSQIKWQASIWNAILGWNGLIIQTMFRTSITLITWVINSEIVGNKVKGRTSKRVRQENKARQIFRKINMHYPQEMFVFWKIWRALFFWNTRFHIRPFTSLPTRCAPKSISTLIKHKYKEKKTFL